MEGERSGEPSLAAAAEEIKENQKTLAFALVL
jgi:hypothetical protein